MTVQPVIRLRLLGRFSAVVDGSPPIHLRISSKKGIALLAYLALNPEHTVSREKLATLLWGDRPDPQARLSLRQCILSLRNSFAPASSQLIVLDGDAVGLRMDLLSVDALEFHHLIPSTVPDDLERATGLYSGDFLSDLEVESEDFAVWLRATRARYEADFARVLEGSIDQRDVSGQGQLAIAAAERLVALDPLREDWQRRLLRAVARHQGSEAALAHAKAFAALLRKELDVDPEPATSALIEQIQRGDIELATPVSVSCAVRDNDELQHAPARLLQAAATPDDGASDRHRPPAPDIIGTPWRRLAAFAHPALVTPRIILPALLVSAGLIFLMATYVSPIWVMNESGTNMAAALPERSPIVVLPFEAHADKVSSAIADQMSNDVIDSLSRVSNLKVISRLALREYRPDRQDIGAIGRELGVRYALHGSIQADAAKLRMNVELIDIATRLQVWSDRFEEDQSDQAVAMDTIAKRLGRALQIEVINFQGERVAGVPPSKSTVEQLVSAGWSAILSGQNAESLAMAEAPFTEALKRDPNRLGAMLGLAAHHTLATIFLPPDQREHYMAEANRLLTRVIERRPGWSPPYYYWGLLLEMQGEPRAALEVLDKCIALNPSFAPGYAQIGKVLTRLGQPDAAIEKIDYAKLLSPKDPAFPLWDMFAGVAEIERGHDATAIDLMARATMLQPNNPFFHASLASAYALTGDWRNAEIHAAKFRELTPKLTKEQRIATFTGKWQPKRFATGARLALINIQ